ncbi:MAG TPA: hypothetical protein VN980_14580 [Alphaproteobacteria bacterium]|nr:hypothetical protein [Alphaproteobacteria bacterium]
MGFVEIWWAVGFPIFLAAVGVGTAYAMIDSSSTEFWIARIAYILAAFDVVGFLTYWLWAVLKWPAPFRLALGALAVPILFLGLDLTLRWVELQEVRLSVTLTPRNVETPLIPATCKVPKGAFMVFMGPNLAIATKMPTTIVQMGGQEMLTIDMSAHQRLIIRTLRILDENNDAIARIEDDDVWAAPSARHEKPDPSTFVVYDQNNAELLRISYLNIQAVLVRVQFHGENLPPLIIGDDKVQWGDKTFVDSCFGDLGRGGILQSQ